MISLLVRSFWVKDGWGIDNYVALGSTGTRNALGEKGWVYREVPLVHTSLEHRPGALAAAARKLADAGINIELMFISGMDGDKVEVSFGVDIPEAAQRALG